MKSPGMETLLRPAADWPAPLRVLTFLLLLALLWLPWLLLVYLLWADPDWRSILTLPVLYGLFIWLARRWAIALHGESQPWVRYGLLRSHNLPLLLLGFGGGALLVFALFGLEALLGWASWQPPDARFGLTALEGLLVGLGIGLAEELLFRGWLLDELSRDYAPLQAVTGNALVFALLHFLKPLAEILRTWPQFCGLVLLGGILGLAKGAAQGRLGLAIGLHGGLVFGYYLINVGALIRLGDRVPDWVTGVDQNPLAGLVGLLFLTALAMALFPYANQGFRLDRSR